MNPVVKLSVRQSPVEDDELWAVLLEVEDVIAIVPFEPISVSVSAKFKVAFLSFSNCVDYTLIYIKIHDTYIITICERKSPLLTIRNES